MHRIANSIQADATPDERQLRPPCAATRDTGFARYGMQAPDGSPTPLPRRCERWRWADNF
ncbi:hypothetical protein VI817_002441 [Penicillium citrinum]|nr:hypothetical protein VI817_002441 [Penicillium citrinum]